MLASVVLSAGLFLSHIQPGTIDIDGGIFSAVAFKDMHGGTLYGNAWENKPPAIFYLMELCFAIIPNEVYALFVMGLLAFLCFGLGLFYLFYRYFDSLWPALFCLGLALIFTIYPNNIGDGLYTEIYGTLCLVVSLVCFEAWQKKPHLAKLIMTGLCTGTAYWFKEPFILPCFFLLLYFAFRIQNRKTTGSLFLFTCIPAIFFLLLLSLQGSAKDFFNTFLYNFQYTSNQEQNDYAAKFRDYFHNLLEPILGVSMLLIFILFKNISEKKTRHESILFLALFISTTVFVFVSPYNFGHYYFPSFVFFFILLGRQYALFRERQHRLTLPFMIVLSYYLYITDEKMRPEFTYHISAFQPDRITQHLINEKDATLFVDYISASNYYIKARKVHPAFLPVGLAVHFDGPIKARNTDRIWKELNARPPDYLITTFTTAYFSWSFPDTHFYINHYEKVDSVFPPNAQVIYLWKYKNMKDKP